MKMVNVCLSDARKGYGTSKNEADVLKMIRKIGTRISQSRNAGEALMCNGAIDILTGAYISKNPDHISYAKSVVSKALASW